MSAPTKAKVKAGIKGASALRDRVRPPAPGITVLIYHRVGRRTPVPVDLPRELFAEQVASLAGRVATLDHVVDALGDGRAPEHDVVVTFDDGTADVIEEALPVLVEHRVPAILYVATAHIEDGLAFPDDGVPASWSALADGLSTGFLQIGSHTHGHALLDRLDAAAAAEELDRSIGLIQDRLGVDPHHFAYPKALLGSAENEALVRNRFRSAAIAGTKANPVGSTDLWRLHRSPIQVDDGMRWFDAKAAGGLGLEDDLRRLVNRVRYRGKTS